MYTLKTKALYQSLRNDMLGYIHIDYLHELTACERCNELISQA